MPARFPMPNAEALRVLLADLLGRAVTLEKATSPDPGEPFVVADYVTESGATGALVSADLVGTAILGAALTMMPSNLVETVRERGVLAEPTIQENFAEVANVIAQLFNSRDTDHLRSNGVHRSDGGLPEPVAALVARPAARRDFACTVEGYGNGRVALVVA